MKKEKVVLGSFFQEQILLPQPMYCVKLDNFEPEEEFFSFSVGEEQGHGTVTPVYLLN